MNSGLKKTGLRFKVLGLRKFTISFNLLLSISKGFKSCIKRVHPLKTYLVSLKPLIITVILIVGFPIFFLSTAKAANDFILYPSYMSLKDSGSYVLTLRNDSQKEANLKLSVILLERKDTRLIPISSVEQEALKLDLEKFVKIDRKEETVAPNSEGEFNVIVSDLNLVPKAYTLSVKVELLDLERNSVSLSADLYSIILNSNLDSEDIAGIDTSVGISAKLNLKNIIFTDSVKLETKIENSSQKSLMGSGGISIFKEINSKLKSKSGEIIELDKLILSDISLTKDLQNFIVPGTSITINTRYIDSRPFYKRLGFVTVEQKIKLNDEDFIVTTRVLFLPWQLIVIAILSVILLIYILKSRRTGKKLRRRFGKRKAK
jgi:hypothetical protein